jgi:methylmalonyl-CoA/ethylmalonyl-CoA epimerase
VKAELTRRSETERISHVGIAVTDLEKAIADFSSLVEPSEIERISLESEKVRIAMLKLGDSEIELLSPIENSGPIARFLEKRGEGIHHIAVKVDDVSQAIENAKNRGFQLLDSTPRSAARGAQAAFVHPKSAHGVLLEFYNQ